MANSLTVSYNNIKERIRVYLNTAYRTNSEEFNQERSNLILDDVSGPMFREPVYELIDRYPLADYNYHEYAENCTEITKKLNPHQKEHLKAMLRNGFGSHKLYEHQIISLNEVFKENRNIVVTTGTGSGKTFCFLAPLVTSLISESLGCKDKVSTWGKCRPPQFNKWWNDEKPNYIPQRQGTTRMPAVRALLMYPLNALVQDQVEGLRKILGSDEAERFYNSSLNGERIFFGQYNGATLGKGQPSNNNKTRECVQKLKEYETLANKVKKEDKFRVFQTHGSELLTRWDMQNYPPDVLITNYSMLAIMLTRDEEQPIFDKTRKWLENDPKNNMFQLIIDELHSYRGTAGTEISYIIKTFLERIGLHPEHPQLRIIATSASLDEGDGRNIEDPTFLSSFFGTNRSKKCFKLISGPTVPCEPGAIDRLKLTAPIFSKFNSSNKNNSDVKMALDEIVKLTTPNELPTGEALNKLKFYDALHEVASLVKNNSFKGLEPSFRT